MQLAVETLQTVRRSFHLNKASFEAGQIDALELSDDLPAARPLAHHDILAVISERLPADLVERRPDITHCGALQANLLGLEYPDLGRSVRPIFSCPELLGFLVRALDTWPPF